MKTLFLSGSRLKKKSPAREDVINVHAKKLADLLDSNSINSFEQLDRFLVEFSDTLVNSSYENKLFTLQTPNQLLFSLLSPKHKGQMQSLLNKHLLKKENN